MKHTSNAIERLQDAKEAIAKQIADFATLKEACEILARTKVSRDRVTEYFATLVPGEAKRAQNTRIRLVELLDHEYQTLPGMGGTLWQAYNAATYWAQYEQPTRGASDDERENNKAWSNINGTSADLTERAMSVALEYA